MDWLKILLPVFGSVVIAVAAWVWQRNTDREIERNKLRALYVNPFLTACHELQSRFYNILTPEGLQRLDRQHPDGRYADVRNVVESPFPQQEVHHS